MTYRAAALLAALVVAGCGGDDDGASSPGADSRCQSAPAALMTPLTNALHNDRDELRNGYFVKSSDHADIYYLSAELDGPGFQDEGDVATFATNSIIGTGLMYSVNDLAKDTTSLRDGTAIAGLSMEDDGAEESFECARGDEE